MTTAVKRPPIQWAFIPSGEMCLQLGVSADTLKDWRVARVLKKGLYWTTFPHIPSRVFWNKDLVRDSSSHHEILDGTELHPFQSRILSIRLDTKKSGKDTKPQLPNKIKTSL